MDNFQGKYKVVDFKWCYIIASFDTLKSAMQWVAKHGMRADHKRGDTTIYAIRG